MLVNKRIKKCSGCNVCEISCPTKCITMKSNYLGEHYAVIDKNKCINCNICHEVCAFTGNKHSDSLRAYAITNINCDKQSQTSGLAYELARTMIQKGGVVYGVAIKSDTVKRIRCRTLEEITELRGSKYVEPTNDGWFVKQVINDLRSGVDVMVIDRECVTSSIVELAKLKKVAKKLRTISLICGGVVPHKIFNDWRKWIINNIPAENFDFTKFRETEHWPNCILGYRYKGVHINDNSWVQKLYLDRNLLRKSCYACKWSSIKSNSDMKIGDYWGHEMTNINFPKNKAVSLALVYSKTGEALLHELQNNMNINDTSKHLVLQPRLIEPTKKGYEFNKFRSLYKKNPAVLFSHAALQKPIYAQSYLKLGRVALGKAVNRNKKKNKIIEVIWDD